jgi:hypothetical protein
MKNSIVIGMVVAMALSVVITGSTLTAVTAQGNLTGDIANKVKSLAATSQIVDDKKRFVVDCPSDVTDPNTQCTVFKIEEYEQ